tara:strand:+ start:190 stop:669 length:480 start_codon:yes stop_codon:yes gene_type:complete
VATPKKQPHELKRRGRPAGDITHDPFDHMDALVEHVLGGGLVIDYCRLDGRPSRATVQRWRDQFPDFARRLADAKDKGLDMMAEEVISIADGRDFTPMADPRLRVDARIRMLSRFSHRYAEKKQIEQTGDSRLIVVTGVPEPEQVVTQQVTIQKSELLE